MTDLEYNMPYDHTDDLILVNARHPITNLVPPKDLVSVASNDRSVLLRRKPATLLQELIRDIRGQSFLSPVSGWRSIQEQEMLWNQSMLENGENFTRQFIARPGCSEHHTGLAVDMALLKDHIDEICPEFPYDGIAHTFRLKAPRYGFIERYPEGKEHITGIHHEPWHFRYVGIPHAQIISDLQITLEEYWEWLKSNHLSAKSMQYNIDGYTFKIEYSTTTRMNMFSGDEMRDMIYAG